MTQARTVLLDNEAVQALLQPRHRKHRRALAFVEAAAARNLRRAGTVRLVVPTAVRVEAGWDRGAAGAAPIDRLRVVDAALDAHAADLAVGVRAEMGVSVTEAALAAAITTTPEPNAVITSDAQDLRAIARHLGTSTTVVVL